MGFIKKDREKIQRTIKVDLDLTDNHTKTTWSGPSSPFFEAVETNRTGYCSKDNMM